MKTLLSITTFFLLFGCSTELVDSWKNPEITSYQPTKVLIIGMTSNTEARTHFESQLKNEMESRGSEAVMSLDIVDPLVVTDELTETQMDDLENKLLDEGFDTILFTKVIGVEAKIRYKQKYEDFDDSYKKFKENYLMYQDIYYNPEYYEGYKLYHTETSMYCICPTKERQLIWKGYIDITDPKNIEGIINEYIKTVIFALEGQHLITPLETEKLSKEAI